MKKERQKVVVPKEIAELITDLKASGFSLLEVAIYVYDDVIQEWIDANCETFALAWLNGYEVDENKKLYS